MKHSSLLIAFTLGLFSIFWGNPEALAQASILGSNCFAVADGGPVGSPGDSSAIDIFVLVNKDTGAEQQLGNIGTFDVEAIEYSPNLDILYAENNGTLIRVDWQSGTNNVSLTAAGNTAMTSTTLGSAGSGDGALGSISFNDIDGLTLDVRADPPILYGSLRRSGTGVNDLLCQINTNNGAIVQDAFGPGVDYLVVSNLTIGGGSVLADIDDIAIDPTDSTMYGILNRSGFEDHLVIIDLTDGSVTDIGVLNIDDAEGLAFYIDGTLFVSTGKDGDNATINSLFDLNVNGSANLGSQRVLNFEDYEGLSCFTEVFGTIGNYAWQDANKDGIQDTNEVGLAGVTVYLHKFSDDSIVATNFTLANGLYSIPISPDDYYVEFIPPSGWVVTTKDAGGDDAKDSDVDPITGLTTNTTIDANEVDLTWDAGYICQPPEISCPDDITLDCTSGVTTNITGSPIVSSPCGLSVTSDFSDVTITNCGNTRVITRTWTATDAFGTSSTCTQLISVVDTNPPVIVSCASNLTLNCNEAIPEPATNDVITVDDCQLVIVTHAGDVTNSFGCSNVITRTYTASDACGNSTNCTQIIIQPYDVTPPVITCAGDTNLGCNALIPSADTNTLSVSDNCELTSVYWKGDVSNQVSECLLEVTRTYVAEDACGNTNFCTQVLSTTTDTNPPIILCPTNLLLECDMPIPAADTNDLLGVSDNCSLQSVSIIQDSTNMTTCTTIVTRVYRAVDFCGNASECTQTITQVDSTPPDLICLPDITITGDVSCVVLIPDLRPDVTDNCDQSPIVTQDPLPGTQVTGPTQIVVTVTATDQCQNSTNCQTIVTVICTAESALGDYVWEDVNLNGRQETNEVGVSNVVVELLDSTNGVITTTQTDTNGYYFFGGLGAGNYSVRFVAPSNAIFTLTNAAPDDVDSDADETTSGQTPQITLAEAETNTTLDVGLIFPDASISIDKTVYLGHDGGASCPGFEVVTSTNQQPVTYCLVVTNTGNTYLSTVLVTDTDLSPNYSNTTALLAPGQVTNLTIDSTIQETLTNTAFVVGTPAFSNGTPIATLTNVTDNDPAVVLEIAAGIKIRKTILRGHILGNSSGCPGLESLVVTNGADITYCIEVENVGSLYLGTIVVSDDSQSFTQNVSVLAPGELTNMVIETTSFGDVVNTACVSSVALDGSMNPYPNAQSIDDCDTAGLASVSGEFLLEKTVYLGNNGVAGCTAATEVVTGSIGDPITYCFTIINPTNSEAKVQITLKDNSISYFQIPFPANMLPGTEQKFAVARTINGDFVNNAEVSAQPADNTFTPFANVPAATTNDSAWVNVDDSDLSIEKTASLDGSCPGVDGLIAEAGTNVTFCFVIRNGGASPLTSVTLKDFDVTPAIDQLVNGGNLAVGQSVTVSVVQVMGSNSMENTAIVTAKAGSVTKVDSDSTTVNSASGVFTLDWTVTQGQGSVDVPAGAYPANSVQVLTAQPDALYSFQEWQGDVVSSNLSINVLMDGDKTLQVLFTETLGTNCVPLLWLDQHGLATTDVVLMNDGDVDGALTWEEYYMGTDPTLTTSVLEVVEQTYDDGVPEMVISWSSEPGRTYTVLRASSLTPENFATIASGIAATPPKNTYTNSVTQGDAYYIYKVEVSDPNPDCSP